MTKTKKPPESEVSEIVPEKLTCESCGTTFSCGANVGKCWCFAVEVKAETLAELKKNYDSCLCEDCLRRAKFQTNGTL